MSPSSVAASRSERFYANPAQAEAIQHVSGPMLVLAGAGTGKTSVLVHRILNLIESGHASPGEIMAITFTNKAAGEIRGRVAAELGEKKAGQLRTFTFHAYCNGVLRKTGLDFDLLTREELWVFLRQRLHELPLQHFLKAADPGKFLEDLLAFFDRCNDELVDAARYADYVEQVCAGKSPLPRVYKSKDEEEIAPEEIIAKCREISGVYTAMEAMLRAEGLLTFGSLITEAVKRLEADPVLAARERENCRYLLIDEFQDSNHAQIELARLLLGKEEDVFAVGDPDQAIYHFRGASSGAFQRFLECFPHTRVVNLAENQRSTPAVLKCAHAAIRRNPEIVSSNPQLLERLARKPLESARAMRDNAQGRPLASLPVELVPYSSYEQEAADIADAIASIRKRTREPWSNFAVLYRSHGASRQLIEELNAREIPFEVTGVDLLDTEVLRDLVAVLHCLHSFDDPVSLFRLAVMPRFGMDAVELQRRMAAAGRNVILAAVLAEMKSGAALLGQLTALRSATDFDRAEVAEALDQAIRFLGLEPGLPLLRRFRELVSDWRKKKYVKQGTLAEFLQFLGLWRTAGGTLDANPAVRDELLFSQTGTGPGNAVQLMTIHAAKGLEFAHVFVLRVVSNSFPASYRERLFEFPRELREGFARVESDDKALHEQEERRLFYVAITRARDTLRLYGRLTGKKPARHPVPSKFLRELYESKGLEGSLALRNATAMQMEIAMGQENAPWLAATADARFKGKLSASALEQYERCPLQFKLARIWNLSSELPAAVQYGAAMHTVLKDFYDAQMQGRPRSEQELVELFRRQFNEYLMEDKLQQDLYVKQGTEQLRAFHQAQKTGPQPRVLGTEVAFEVKIGGATVVGRLDRLDEIEGDAVAIVDYKTGNPKTEEDAERSLQLSVYALAVRQQFQKYAGELVFYNLETNTAVSGTRSDATLASAEEKIRQIAEGIAVRKFPATAGFHCRWCGYRAVCPSIESAAPAFRNAVQPTDNR